MDSPFYQKPQKSSRRGERRNIRVEVQATVRYHRPPENTETSITASVSNISEGGALFVTHRQGIPVGAEIRATFPLRGSGNEFPITVAGHIKHSRYLPDGKYGSGVEFSDLSEEAKRKIRDFVVMEQLNEAL